MGTVRIGEWRFDGASGELAQGAEKRRLEDRAARTLALLCRRRGEVVTQDEIIAEVWNGRQQSPNSVAVVISDLRRALGEDAREPKHIETVTKRGYRLSLDGDAGPDAEAPATARRLSSAWILALVLLTGFAVAGGFAWRQTHPPKLILRLEPTVNETGDPRFGALARAVDGLIVTDLQAQGRTTLVSAEGPSSRPPPRLVMQSKLILWDGHPSVVMTAIDPATGVAAWSGLAPGPETALPDQVERALARFGVGKAGPRGDSGSDM